MKFLRYFINPCLVITSIYIPLFLFSFLEYKLSKVRNEKASKWASYQQKLEYQQKINAVELGYKPTFPPYEMFNLGTMPNVYHIGSLPYTNSYQCDEGYGLIKYKTDRFGLRNNDLKWKNIMDQENIFLLGDSFVHGDCVPGKATISENIERNIGLNTVNLGMGGNGPYEYMASLKSVVKPILEKSSQKNKVIILFFTNDKVSFNKDKRQLLNNTNSIVKLSNNNWISPKIDYLKNVNNFILRNYDLSPKVMIEEIKKNLPVGAHVQKLPKTFKRTSFYYVASFVPLRRELKSLNLYFKSKKVYKNSPSEESIIMLSKICNNNCEPIVAYISWNKDREYRVPIQRWLDPNANKYKMELKNIAKKLNVKFLDSTEIIDVSDESEDTPPNGGHLSIEGYKKLADFITQNMSKK